MLTDYTEKDTFQAGFSQQYRILKYIKDILNNWFTDQRNIKDPRLVTLLYDKNGNLLKDCLSIKTPFNPDGKYTGTTPAVLVSLGDIHYTRQSITEGNTRNFINNPMLSITNDYRLKQIPIIISIVTEHYDGTVLLAQLIETFLQINSDAIREDNKSLSYVSVQGISAPREIKPGQQGNAKDLYLSQIQMNTTGTLVWSIDTQGPVFKGINNLTQQLK